MKRLPITKIFFMVGLLVFLKLFQDFVPRISEPKINLLVFIGVIIFFIIFGISQIRASGK